MSASLATDWTRVVAGCGSPRRWKTGIATQQFGVRIAFQSNRRIVLNRVRNSVLTGAHTRCSGSADCLYEVWCDAHDVFHLHANGACVAKEPTEDRLLEQLRRHLELFVSEQTCDFAFIHAGVVGWRGGAIVIPGVSGSGKSTLVAALLSQGATYYSDEYAVLDRQGRVHPYPRPLRLRSCRGSDISAVRSNQRVALTCETPLPVRTVVVTEFRDGARWFPQPISEGEAGLAMVANALPIQRSPELTLCCVARSVASAKSLRGVRGAALVTASQLLDLIDK